MMTSRIHVQSAVLSVLVLASGCTTANVGGDVSSAPLRVPATQGNVASPVPGPVVGGSAVTTADPAILRSGVWVLVALGSSDVTPARRNPAHVSFAEATRVTGATGCNRLTGGVTVDEQQMRFGALATTRMACQDAGDVEARFLEALAATRAWAMDSGRLLLRDAAGRTMATLVHRDALN